MKHLTEEELVDRYNGEEAPEVKLHLEGCGDCADAFAVLKADLGEMKLLTLPERDAEYGERVWTAIAPLLAAYTREKPWWQRRGMWFTLLAGAACAAMVAGAFYAGRMWEHRKPHPTLANAPSAAHERVVVVLLSDHLDRSERLLVELKHANPDDSQIVSPLRDEARTLLQSNWKYRAEAERSGDPALTSALDDLNRLLTQLAEAPGGLDPAAITRLQEQMKADGLLFEVRVLRSRIPNRGASMAPRMKGGTT